MAGNRLARVYPSTRLDGFNMNLVNNGFSWQNCMGFHGCAHAHLLAIFDPCPEHWGRDFTFTPKRR